MNKPTEIRFLTVQTPYGLSHTAAVAFEDGIVRDGYAVLPARPSDAAVVAGKLLAKNGTAWAIGRTADGYRLAWKTVKLSKRFGRESYRMRSVPGGYKGDYATCWSRSINGKTYSFSRVFWNAGQDGWTINVFEGQTTKLIKSWGSSSPVTMKGKKSA